MAFDPITAVLNIGNTIIDRLIPDKTVAAQAKAQLLQMEVQGELAAIAGQLEVNKAEASNESVFVAGWRPAVGWACAACFGYTYVLQPFIALLLAAFHHDVALPVLNLDGMMPVLLGMLGLAGMRSYDKTKGTGNGS